MRHPIETEQWLLEQARSNMLRRGPDALPDELRRFSKSFWPFMEPYYSPLKPVFSFELPHLSTSQSSWMLRDGAIPLAWFFESATEAPFEIVVSAALGALVPRRWQKATRFFEIYSEENFHAGNLPKNLFLSGPVNPGVATLEELDAILDRAVETLGAANLEKVFVYSPVRQNMYVQAEEESFEFQYYHRIHLRFGKTIRFLHWQEIEHASFHDTAFLDLNGGWLYSDSFVAHQVLRAGGGLLRAPSARVEGSERVPLSRYHGVEVTPVPQESRFCPFGADKNALAFYSALHRKTMEPRSHIPWPKWYEGAFRAGQKRGRAQFS